MRKPDTIERLYLDFDGFFASVEQQAYPALRGRPVGVVPMRSTVHTCIIACSREAKSRGIKNVMKVSEAQKICPEIVLKPQSPDLYRRAHNALLREISSVIPVEVVKSIDELSCILGPGDRADPEGLARRIKQRLRDNIGPYITCSIGFAANRQLAKIACKMDKPDGVTVWHPADMPAPLLPVPFDDIPGIGRHMAERLGKAGIHDVEALLQTSPKQLRKLWRNVTGERLWYALHGYAIHSLPSKRTMFGHGRVLPPDRRSLYDARECSRLLLTKAARRLRRGGFYSGRLSLWLSMRHDSWSASIVLPIVNDDHGCLDGLRQLWQQAEQVLPLHTRTIQLGVTLLDLSPATERQLDLFLQDDRMQQKWEKLTAVTDALNMRYGKTVLSLGGWKPPPGGYAGGKISFTRIPKAEDFW